MTMAVDMGNILIAVTNEINATVPVHPLPISRGMLSPLNKFLPFAKTRVRMITPPRKRKKPKCHAVYRASIVFMRMFIRVNTIEDESMKNRPANGLAIPAPVELTDVGLIRNRILIICE